jgi:hypothetical protein
MSDAGLFDEGPASEAPAPSAEIVLRASITRLLGNIGDHGLCKGCASPITWVRHKNGIATPYDGDGANHFISCVERERFRKQKK